MDDCRFSLHLFAGAGGGILADVLSGRTVVGAVEVEEYQRLVLMRRILDGVLPSFPLWDDVRTFRLDNPDTAEYIQWLIEIRDELCICGGFPCQDVSVAGKGGGLDGRESGLWYEYMRIVREIRPRKVFIENSPMLRSRGLDRVLEGLAEAGYDAVWNCLSASKVGAWHKRERMWICAYANES